MNILDEFLKVLGLSTRCHCTSSMHGVIAGVGIFRGGAVLVKTIYQDIQKITALGNFCKVLWVKAGRMHIRTYAYHPPPMHVA